MKAKLFMIPWIIKIVLAQNGPNVQSSQGLAGDLLMNAHHRHFYEILRRQQQINDALLMNNALLHPLPQLAPLTANPEALIPPPLPQHPAFYNPFGPAQASSSNQGSASKGSYDKEELKAEDVAVLEEAVKEGTIEKDDKKTLAGVKTVFIQRKGEVVQDEEKSLITTTEMPIEPTTTTESTTTTTPTPTTTTTIPITTTTTTEQSTPVPTTTSEAPKLSAEDLEVLQLFKKLNLSKEETKNIVEHVENVVREELTKKLKEAENQHNVPEIPVEVEVAKEIEVTPSSIVEETTTIITTTTTEAPTTTTTIRIPQLRLRTNEEEQEELVINRNNLKHHPIKYAVKKLEELKESDEEDDENETEKSQGSIKTSLTHLPIIVTNEEEEKELTPTLHRRILIASHNRGDKADDRDLLVDFATGAPLDLNDNDFVRKELASSRLATTVLPSPLPTRSVVPVRTTLPPRQPHHEMTNFERLASDYRQRLENTGDINKILQKISENAYISLVERGGRRKLFRP